jgi:hypothetical protein
VNPPVPDVRWRQRFANFRRALQQLESFSDPPPSNEWDQQGLIKAFEYSYELGWNSLRDQLLDRGATDLIGSQAEEIAQRIETRCVPSFQALRLRLGEIETQELEACPSDGCCGCRGAEAPAQRTPSHLWLCRLSRQAGWLRTKSIASS